jgi:translation initiation factor 3 subunit L
MTIRHITVKLKPQLNDHLNSWSNYCKLFELIVKAPDVQLCVSTQWIYDITQEFAYQFQGFCQYRCQHGHQSTEVARVLQEHRDAWNYPEVISILNKLIKAGKAKSVQAGERLSVIQQFGYFASIELARLDCLAGDYSSSLAAIAHLKLNDRKELFVTLPICYFNVYYHIGVCNMMLKRFDESLDVLGEIILNVIRMLKPGAAASLRPGVESTLRRMVERAMGLAAILITIKPNHRIEDQVKDAIESKFGDKMRRLQNGDRTSAVELFEGSCPKFITLGVPEFGSGLNVHNVAMNNQSNVLVTEVMQHIPFLKIRSLLNLYSSIDISKLSRFVELSDSDLICALLSLKNKQLQAMSGSKTGKPLSDIHFYVDGGVLIVDSSPVRSDLTAANEKHFAAGVKKHYEIMNHLNKTFRRLNEINQEKPKNK